MKKTFFKKYDAKFWLILLAEIAIAFGIFLALSAWQTRNMLADEEQVPVLTAPTISGSMARFPDLTTDRHSLVYFFAPWCTVCHLSIENLNYVQAQNPELNILIVALDYQSVAEVEEFLSEHSLDYPVLLGDRRWSSAYKVTAFPSYYVIDSGGRVVSRSMGYSTMLGMMARVAQVEDLQRQE